MTAPQQCPWCNAPGVAATWTPRYGWIDLCTRHHAEITREVIAHIIEQAALKLEEPPR